MTEASEAPIAEEHHDLLEGEALGTLSTVRPDGMLSSNPVGFLFQGGSVRISTLRERFKVRNIAADPRVAFVVQSTTNPLRYVELRGTASISEDPDRSFFRAQFRAGAGVDPPDDVDPPEAQRVVLTLHPQKVSAPQLYGGRFDVEG